MINRATKAAVGFMSVIVLGIIIIPAVAFYVARVCWRFNRWTWEL